MSSLFNSNSYALSIAQESTVVDPCIQQRTHVLPFGFIQSPIIASICLYKSALGQYLDGLTRNDFTVSVYMDDIIISSNHTSENMNTVFDILKQKADRSRLLLNPDKTFAPSPTIEAFNIELQHEKMKITNEKLSAFINTICTTSDIKKIDGILGYIKSVNQEQYNNCSSTANIG